jgi:hypothetical protein
MAECLQAWLHGDEDSPMADAGGLMVAEALTNLDVCAKVAVAFAKSRSQG